MRVACLNVADFPLAVSCRAEPELRGEPLAVTQGGGARAPLLACSPEAAACGVRSGMSAAQARAVCSRILFRCVSPQAARAAGEALCDVAYAHSPRIEEGGAGTVFLDLGGMRALYASEPELARSLVRCAAEIGFDAAAGIASSKVAARLAARGGCGRVVIPPGEEWSCLAPLPVALLEPPPPLAATLLRWGIRTLGDLAALPAAALASRLGPAASLLVRRARGEDEAPFAPRPARSEFVEVVDFDHGLESIEPFLFAVRPLLERLVTRLALRGLACGDLHIGLRLANRARDERRVAVAAPSREIKPLLALLRLHLESHPPAAPVDGIAIVATGELLRPVQLDLLRPNGPAPAQLAMTLARLTALCGGADRVGTPVVAESHRPDAYAVGEFRPAGSAAADAAPPFDGGVPIALRALRPPRPLEVILAVSPRHTDTANGAPGRLEFVRCADASDNRFRCHGRVVMCAGPWREQGEWWTDRPYRRDYYDVQLSDGGVYRIYHDATQNKWFADGYYD